MKKLYSILLMLLVCYGTKAQTTTVTTGIPSAPSSGSGGSPPYLAFVVDNTNNYAIVISAIDMYKAVNSSGMTFELRYSTTSLSGTPSPAVGSWTLIKSELQPTVTATGIYPAFTNLNFTVPANTMYRFAVINTTSSNLQIGSTTSVPNYFSNGGVGIAVGNYQINGLSAGYWSGNANYFWGGSVIFAPATPCVNPPTAGTAIVSNSTPCTGMGITFNLSGGTGGLGQTYQWQSAPSATGPWTNIAGATSGYYPTTGPAATTFYRHYVVCGSGSDTTAPLQVTIPSLFPGGTYTIDNTASAPATNNFTSFAAAAAAINCGITGPITFNVANSIYNNDHFRLDNYLNGPGKSITINGNGATLSNVSTLASEPAIIKLNGTKFVTVNNLNIQGISSSTSQYAWGVFMTNNADSNTITNCTITLDTTATSTNYAGIVLSGGATATTAGSGCDGIVISNNIIKGGYYGITLMGNTTTNILQRNTITNNVFKDFYVYGIYASYSNNMTIAENDISRPSRTSVTTFGGIYLTTGHNNLNVSKNRIHDAAAGNPNASFTQYGIYLSGAGSTANPNIFSNNLIYNMQGGGTGIVYGLYNTGGTYSRYYHNTISNDFAGSTGTAAAYGFYQTGTATGIQFYNNNISVTRGGTGANFGIYLNTATATITSNNNNFYVNGTGTNNMGFSAATTHTSLGAWQTATSQDAASTNVDPVFLNPIVGNLMPTNGGLDDKGTPILGITTDITNAVRSTVTPDIGAYEFVVAPCGGTPTPGTIVGPTTACSGANFTLTLTGYTIGTGINIQWQSSPAGASVFTNITGATSPSYSINQTSATDYRAIVTCANGGGNDVTTTYTVNMDPFYLCYCSPFTGVQLHTNTSNFMTNVSIPNTTLNSPTTTLGAGGYSRLNYNIGTNTATLSQTTPYPLTVTVTNASYSVMAWVDYDQSGTFDSIEATQLTNSGTTATGNIIIPVSALTGLTGLRVRVHTTTPYGMNGACTSITTGYETEDYVITVAGPPSCIQPSGFSVANLTSSSADISWIPVTGANGYEWAVGTTATPPTSGTPITTMPASVGGLFPSTVNYFFVRTDCGTNGYSLWSTYAFTTAAINNDPWNAIPVTVGNACTGNAFTTIGGSHAAGEPYPTCAGTNGHYSVWYSFVAPPSGAVKITTDFAGGTLGDSRLGLFSTSNVNSYPAYTILACDDDNGSAVATRSIIYATGLTNNVTYYVLVDVFDAVAQAGTSVPGTFCLEVHELNSSMLASTGNCAAGQVFSINAGYKASSALTDASSNLIAIFTDTAGTAATYAVNLTKNTGAVRSTGGQYYLDRNFLINGATTGNIELQLFFATSELTALQGVVPGATLSNLNVTRQSGTTCQATFSPTGGTNTGLLQTGNGSVNSVNWITVVTPGFSNFYIQSGTTP
ncbi:MAG TPA: right-handed parallel beta-helix repeat-containing protein, partial [Flavipsychrobacter sp.]|nr:right-handed parallel beta-helix repeat-containing protein [Flavipsychrobacter sp.]